MVETFNYTQFESGLDISFLYQSIGNNMIPYKNNNNNNNNNLRNNNMNNNMENNFDDQLNDMNINIDINNNF